MNNRLFTVAVVLLSLAIATPSSAVVDFNVAGSVDFQGSLNLEGFTPDADPGFTLGLEVMFDVPIVELGAGIEYGFPRSVDGGGDVDYWNLYGVARLTLFFKIYLVGRIGYAASSADDFLEGDLEDNSASWSLGAGIGIVPKFKVELLYSDFGGDLKYQTWSARAIYTF